MAVIKADDSQIKDLLTDNQKVVVKYYADWCGNCRLFAPKYKRISDNEQYAGITFLDVNAEHSPEARKMAGVTNLPFFAIFKVGQFQEGIAASKEEAVLELIHKLNN
jgi:thioredoxin 1